MRFMRLCELKGLDVVKWMEFLFEKYCMEWIKMLNCLKVFWFFWEDFGGKKIIMLVF